MKNKNLERFILENREQFDTATPRESTWNAIEQALHTPQRLEQFFATNREAFDEANPSFRVWSSIDKTLHPQQQPRTGNVVSIRRILSVAALVLLLLTVGAMAGIYFTQSQAQTNEVASLADISPEYAEMVRYYDAQINEKAKQVSLESKDKSILEDLKAVDKAMAELEAELQKAPKGAEEQIVANLVKSYQIKLDILERVLERIQSKQDNSKKQNKKDDEVSI